MCRSLFCTYSSLSFVLFITYNAVYAWRVWVTPDQTNIGFNLDSRKEWVCNPDQFLIHQVSRCMATAPGRMLGIQAVRNASLTTSFFGSTSLTVAFFVGVVRNFLGLTTTARDALRNCGIKQIQELLLAATLFWSFVHWIISNEGKLCFCQV